MNYELAYDAAHAFAGWQVLAIGVPICALMVATTVYDKFPPLMFIFFHGSYEFARTVTGFALLIFIPVCAAIIYNNIKLASLSRHNDCTQIAGVVTDFKPRPVRGVLEKFTLNDIQFEYSNFSPEMGGFAELAADGGPIYEGANIRLCYITRIKNRKKEKTIIRVETRS